MFINNFDMFLYIQDVQPNSPADIAGLRTNTDYIIGADSVLHEVKSDQQIAVKYVD